MELFHFENYIEEELGAAVQKDIALRRAESLIEKGMTVKEEEAEKKYLPIHCAVKYGSLRLVKLNLFKDAKMKNVCTKDGVFPVLLAVQFWQPDILTLLLKEGANVNQQIPETGQTVLHMLLAGNQSQQYLAYLRLLISAGIDMLLEDSKGKAAFEYFNAEKCDIPTTCLLLEELAIQMVASSSPNSWEKRAVAVLANYNILSKYFDSCIEYANRLKLCRINKAMTALDLLTKGHVQIANLMRRTGDLRAMLNSIPTKDFSMYFWRLNSVIAESVEHAVIEKRLAKDYIGAFQFTLPSLVIEKIVKYGVVNKNIQCCKHIIYKRIEGNVSTLLEMLD